ncbi:hypothetical protein [Nocardioides iriomotensis]|uniref:DUF11 domain-containing protein n=1 Tax=Nocardioides iriomotensis TaxID=715784 RepID=A0A4Q5J4X5_9ACTN|nr:hypothetical protein [Nocardioides iriomotensis]RYU13682.1 hypothetical protein ETU37_05425 [Nocardioides iriomotensis]
MTLQEHASERRLIDRRTVVRGAAVAAWTVPAVQLVGAAPAFAGSGPTSFSGLSGSGSYSTPSRLLLLVSFNNAGASPATGVQVTVKMPRAMPSAPTAAGWNVSGSGDTFVFTLNATVPAGQSQSLQADFTVSDTTIEGTAAVALTATNVTGTSNTNAPITPAYKVSYSGPTVSNVTGNRRVSVTAIDNIGSLAGVLRVALTLDRARTLVGGAPSGWSHQASNGNRTHTFTRGPFGPSDSVVACEPVFDGNLMVTSHSVTITAS